VKEVLDSLFATHYASKDPAVLERTRPKLVHLRGGASRPRPLVVAEVANFVRRMAGRKEALSRVRAIEQHGLEMVPLDGVVARDAGLLRCTHRDVPLADCVIAATAIRAGGLVIPEDPHIARIKGLRVSWL